MQVVNGSANFIQVEAKPAFKEAIAQFHAAAGADAWDEKILTTTRKSGDRKSGDVAVATIVPKRNNRHIVWSAESLHTSKRPKTSSAAPRVTPAEKTDADNKGNFSGNQTKY
tara:strand:- start:380 stop:715 length:336 start_codon:yes stop_codon:yes gene_type:complete